MANIKHENLAPTLTITSKSYILPLVFVMIICSCGQTERNSRHVAGSTHTSSPAQINQQGRDSKIQEVEAEDYADSIRLGKVLQDALELANEDISKDTFDRRYVESSGRRPVSVEMSLNYHFSKIAPHLIIRRTGLTDVHIDIYSKKKDKFANVLSHLEWSITYVNDTLRDVNGDGLIDFVVNWYGSNGCYLKAFSNVYLLRPDNKTFSDDFEFINPTFSSTEKVIRGICYGQPGSTAMYKYRWNRESVDTVHYISYQRNAGGVKTGKIIVSTRHPSRDQFKTSQILNSVPSEYTTIEGYDWFTGEEHN